MKKYIYAHACVARHALAANSRTRIGAARSGAALDGAKTVAVCGATGRQGGAVGRRLLEQGWLVRALTRKPDGSPARSLAALGATVVRADMNDRRSLDAAFEGAYGVYSVQNPVTSGLAGEVEQGKNVADAAKAAGVQHVVYGSAGFGEPTGVGSWDSKVAVEAHMRALELPVTTLRPMAFMELMTDKGFYPQLSTWHVMPKLAGPNTKIGWLAVDDLGVIAATVFADPVKFAGKAFSLVGDDPSIDECRAIWREVRGRRPRGVPIPVALFERLAGDDLTTMWRWVRKTPLSFDTGPTRELHPHALTVRDWLRTKTEERGNDGR